MNSSVGSVLEVRNVKISFQTEQGVVPVLRGLSYTLDKGKVLAVVGESGSGKTVHALSLLRLLATNARILEGEIFLNGKNILSLAEKSLQSVRGEEIAMIFQDPSASLNPVLTVGEQLTETLLAHRKISKQEAFQEAARLLTRVGIADAEKRLREYPFQFSGGMCQRVMIAMALALKPNVLVADEPTTALDVTIQAQILELIKKLQQETGMSVVFITHNLALACEIADEVLVLYGGLCMEKAPVTDLFQTPLHPYTKGLLSSLVTLDETRQFLPAISGNPPVPGENLTGCPFAPRCKQATEKCRQQLPPLFEKSGRQVRCWLEEPL